MLKFVGAQAVEGFIVLRQVRSPIGRPATQRQTLIALGLNKIDRVSILRVSRAVLGQHKKVAHLVTIVDEFSSENALSGELLTKFRSDPHGRKAVNKFLTIYDANVLEAWNATELLFSPRTEHRIAGIRRMSRLLQTRRDAGQMETSFSKLSERDFEIFPRLLYNRIFDTDLSVARQAAYALVANSTVSAGLDPTLDARELGHEAATRFRDGLIEFLASVGLRFVIDAHATATPASANESLVDVDVIASRRLGFDIDGGDVLLPEIQGSLGPETPVVASPMALRSRLLESWRAEDLHKGDHRGDLIKLKARLTLPHESRNSRPLPVSFLMLGAVEHRDLHVL